MWQMKEEASDNMEASNVPGKAICSYEDNEYLHGKAGMGHVVRIINNSMIFRKKAFHVNISKNFMKIY